MGLMYRGFVFILPVAAGLLIAISGMGSAANAQTLTVTAQGQIPQTCTVAADPTSGNAGLNASGSLSTTGSTCSAASAASMVAGLQVLVWRSRYFMAWQRSRWPPESHPGAPGGAYRALVEHHRACEAGDG